MTPTPTLRPAAFLDRDGTIIVDTDHVRDPGDVRLLPGAAAAIARLNGAGIPVVIVTNQSGIARGYFTAADYERVRERMESLLDAENAHVDATYVCPHHPDFTGACDCRKPGTGLFERAASELHLDPSRSAYIGDRWRDIAVAEKLGGRGVLVLGERTMEEDQAHARARAETATSLGEAVDRLLASYWRRSSSVTSAP